jgi:hypothetical protein
MLKAISTTSAISQVVPILETYKGTIFTRVDPKEICITLRPVPDALCIFFKKELNIQKASKISRKFSKIGVNR